MQHRIPPGSARSLKAALGQIDLALRLHLDGDLSQSQDVYEHAVSVFDTAYRRAVAIFDEADEAPLVAGIGRGFHDYRRQTEAFFAGGASTAVYDEALAPACRALKQCCDDLFGLSGVRDTPVIGQQRSAGERVPVAALCERVLEPLLPAAWRKGVTVTLPETDEAWSGPARPLGDLIATLMAATIRCTRPGGEVTVTTCRPADGLLALTMRFVSVFGDTLADAGPWARIEVTLPADPGDAAGKDAPWANPTS